MSSEEPTTTVIPEQKPAHRSCLNDKLSTREPDTSFAWLVVFSSFTIHFVVLGIQYTFGLFVVPYISTFGSGKGAVSFAGSLASFIWLASGALTGRFADSNGYRLSVHIGCVIIALAYGLASLSTQLWHIYLTQGVLGGLGSSLVYFPCIAVVNQWFVKRRGFAVGVAVSGSGIGNLALAPVTQAMITQLGWRHTLLILGGMAFVFVFAVSWLVIRRDTGSGPVPLKKSSRIVDFSWFKYRNFRIMYISALIGQLGYLLPFIYVAPFAIENGLGEDFGATCLAILGASSAVGRILLGALADRLGHFPVYKACVLVSGVAMVAWPWMTTRPTLAIFCVIYGIAAGGFISCIPVLVTIFFGLQNLAGCLGLLYTSGAMANLAGPPLAGLIIDQTNTYTWGILIFASLMVLSLSIISLIRPPSSKPLPVVSQQQQPSSYLVIDSRQRPSSTNDAIADVEMQVIISPIDDTMPKTEVVKQVYVTSAITSSEESSLVTSSSLMTSNFNTETADKVPQNINTIFIVNNHNRKDSTSSSSDDAADIPSSEGFEPLQLSPRSLESPITVLRVAQGS
mmetsp:Transcript_26426/g.43275  ORF Transcript_26426/g.43275 Transcript_26426/m.43275 type:complete len:568 (+) Transcript_26426:118-1821(+)